MRPHFLPPSIHKAIEKPIQAGQVVHVDLFFLPKKKNSDACTILIVVDACTKYVRLGICIDKKSYNVWDAFERFYIFEHGSPSVVISDNDGTFTSFFHNRLVERSIKHITITPLNPRANG